MNSFTDILTLLVLALVAVPAAAAVLVAVAGRAGPGTARRLSVYAAGAHLALAATLVTLDSGYATERLFATTAVDNVAFAPRGVPGDDGAGGTSWGLLPLAAAPGGRTPPPEVQFFVGADGLNVPLIALASLMVFVAVLLSAPAARPHAYYAWVFALQAALVGAFLSFDVVLFYVFFELTLIPAFFLIGTWGTGGGRRDAARKFVLYTLLGSLVTLVGVVGVVVTNPTPVRPPPAPFEQQALGEGVFDRVPAAEGVSFSIPVLTRNAMVWDTTHHRAVLTAEERLRKAGPAATPEMRRQLDDAIAARDRRRSVQGVLFFLLAAGFVVKVPLVPFHTWLPAAYAAAPLPVTVLLSAVVAKLGTFGLLRVVIPLVPEAAVRYGLPVLGTLGAVGIVYAALCAYAQRDLRLLAAYSSVSHLGFLVLGLFALNAEGIGGAVLHMVNHGLTAGALFGLLAFLHRRYGTTDANQYGGLWAKYPRFAFLTIVIGLAAVGVPGFNNFVSEMLMLGGLFDPRNVALVGYAPAAVAAFGVFLSAWYTFTMVRRVVFGPLHEPPAAAGAGAAADAGGGDLWPIGLLAAACLALGLFPGVIVNGSRADAGRVVKLLDLARLRLDPTAARPERPEPAAVETPDTRLERRMNRPAPPGRPPGGPPGGAGGPPGRPGGPPQRPGGPPSP